MKLQSSNKLINRTSARISDYAGYLAELAQMASMILQVSRSKWLIVLRRQSAIF